MNFYDLGLILHNGKTEYNKQSVKIVLSAESRLMLFLGKVILQMFRYTSIYLFTTPPIRLLVRTQTVSLYQQLSLWQCSHIGLFESFWWQIYFKNYPKYLGTFCAVLKTTLGKYKIPRLIFGHLLWGIWLLFAQTSGNTALWAPFYVPILPTHTSQV